MPPWTAEQWKTARRNPHAARVAAEFARQRTSPGQPRKGEPAAPTESRTLKLTPALWALVADRAKAEGLTVHAALRKAVLAWARGEAA